MKMPLVSQRRLVGGVGLLSPAIFSGHPCLLAFYSGQKGLLDEAQSQSGAAHLTAAFCEPTTSEPMESLKDEIGRPGHFQLQLGTTTICPWRAVSARPMTTRTMLQMAAPATRLFFCLFSE